MHEKSDVCRHYLKSNAQIAHQQTIAASTNML